MDIKEKIEKQISDEEKDYFFYEQLARECPREAVSTIQAIAREERRHQMQLQILLHELMHSSTR